VPYAGLTNTERIEEVSFADLTKCRQDRGDAICRTCKHREDRQNTDKIEEVPSADLTKDDRQVRGGVICRPDKRQIG
jgi:hypothetical protein